MLSVVLGKMVEIISVPCEQYIWIVIGVRHSPVPPQIKPKQKTAASQKPSEFLSCHLVRKGSQETLVGGSG